MRDRDEPARICGAHNVAPDPPTPSEMVGVALATLTLVPLNGLRHPAQGGTCGWYIWGGPEFSDNPDFREHPEVRDMIARGELHLTALLMIGPYLGGERHGEIL